MELDSKIFEKLVQRVGLDNSYASFPLFQAPGEVWEIVRRADGEQKAGCELSSANTPVVSPVSLAESSDDEECCRFCYGEERSEDPTNRSYFISPCACEGTQKYVHLGCLRDWQRIQRKTGQEEKALRCDVCKERFACKPEPLKLMDKLQVWGHTAVKLYVLGTFIGAIMGGTFGSFIALDVVYKLSSELVMWLDEIAADSFLLALLGPYMVAVALPTLFVGAYSVVATFSLAGMLVGAATASVAIPRFVISLMTTAMSMGVGGLQSLTDRILRLRHR